MKVLVDMNLSPAWVSLLAEAGFEAIHWSDVGAANAPDDELLIWAAEHGCIALTADLDFGAILAAARTTRPSVVQVRSEKMRQAREELLEGALISVDAARARLRILPLKQV
jgi:predicted nuclease of predicted toxin-antitoxin system